MVLDPFGLLMIRSETRVVDWRLEQVLEMRQSVSGLDTGRIVHRSHSRRKLSVSCWARDVSRKLPRHIGKWQVEDEAVVEVVPLAFARAIAYARISSARGGNDDELRPFTH